MNKRLINWLNKPYYYNDDNTFKFKLSIGIGLFIFIFLVIFSPANLKIESINPYVFKLIIALITILNLLFFFFVFTKLFPSFFNNEHWTIGKHFLSIFCLIFFSSIIRWLFTNYILAEDGFNAISFLKMAKNSFLIGTIPVLIYIYLDEKYQSKKIKTITDKVMSKAVEKIELRKKLNTVNSRKQVIISATNKKDFLKFKISDLIYVTSDTNYACFYIKEKDTLKEYILRLPLKDVEDYLNEFKNIIRCHKSFIINTDYVKKISGNARGYYLHIKEVANPIPVSRKFTQKDLENLIFA